MKLLTIFTPAYNRRHTINRTYESMLRQTCKDFQWLVIDDGSTDETKNWIQSLGKGKWIEDREYDWMGRRTEKVSSDHHYAVDIPNGDSTLHIDYIFKPNGGLYTGYNVAYDIIDTELCVCIDSDDYAADDTVEKVQNLWSKHYPQGSINYKLSTVNQKEYCGILGLDFSLDGKPFGGYLPEDMKECYRSDLLLKKIHDADCKEFMRTDLMKKVAPQIGFKGEKNFNPSYMLVQVWDKYPLLVINDNLCFVDYQYGVDSMSQGIWKQYVNSPKSYAKFRRCYMQLSRYPFKEKYIIAAHYISSCIFAKDRKWLKNSPMKLTTILAIPIGLLIHAIIKYKTR